MPSKDVRPSAHYTDAIMGTIASQITNLAIVYSTVYSDADPRKYQSSASLASVRGIHRRPVNSPHKWPVTRKMFPFDDVIMKYSNDYKVRHIFSQVSKFLKFWIRLRWLDDVIQNGRWDLLIFCDTFSVNHKIYLKIAFSKMTDTYHGNQWVKRV